MRSESTPQAEPLLDLPTLGTRLRWARQRAALNQTDLARRLGKRQQYLSALEQDRIESPAPAILAALAAVLGVSPAWLMYGATAPTADSRAAGAGLPAVSLTAEESQFLQDYRTLTERDRTLVRGLVQELHRLPPGSNPPPASVSESAHRQAPPGEHRPRESQRVIQTALPGWLLPPPER
jgi:transcriptional regulator with XRE-family HTH domain